MGMGFDRKILVHLMDRAGKTRNMESLRRFPLYTFHFYFNYDIFTRPLRFPVLLKTGNKAYTIIYEIT